MQVEPEFYADKKDALIGEFKNYLKILRSVHSGADLQASAEAAGGSLPGSVKGYLGYVLSHQFDSQILPLIENAVEARTELAQAMKGKRWVWLVYCRHIMFCVNSNQRTVCWSPADCVSLPQSSMQLNPEWTLQRP